MTPTNQEQEGLDRYEAASSRSGRRSLRPRLQTIDIIDQVDDRLVPIAQVRVSASPHDLRDGIVVAGE
jgi:hypothetical protein